MPGPTFTYTAEGDISDAIMAALKVIFQSELIDQVPTNDKLRLRKLIELPLQDDPTRVAPYVTYGTAWELDESEDPDQLEEIGSGMLLRTPFKILFGTPLRTNRIAAMKAIGELKRRIRGVLMRHYALNDVTGSGLLTSADGNEYIDAMSPHRLHLSAHTRTFGGESTWYGEGLIVIWYSWMQKQDWIP